MTGPVPSLAQGSLEVLVFQAPHTGVSVRSEWDDVDYYDEGATIPGVDYGNLKK